MFTKTKKNNPTPMSVSALINQQHCCNTCPPPSVGKGLCDCHQYNYKVLGLHPSLAATRVDFGLHLPVPAWGKCWQEGVWVPHPKTDTCCSPPKQRTRRSCAVGKVGQNVGGGSIQITLLTFPCPRDARQGAQGAWGHKDRFASPIWGEMRPQQGRQWQESPHLNLCIWR